MRRSNLTGAALAALLVACGGGDSPTGPPPTPVPTQLSLANTPSSSAQNGVPLATQPAVRLRDASNAPVAKSGVVVSAALVSGGATLSNATASTDANGVATFSGLAILGPVGPYTLRFSSPDLTSVDAPAITLTAGPPSKLSVATAPPAVAKSGVALSPAPAVQLLDQSDNTASQSGVSVTASLVSGTLALSSAQATTDATGRATFSGLILAGTAGSYTLRFSATGLGSVDASSPTQLGAGDPSQLVLTTAPASTAQSGVTLGTQPVVEVRDAWGNPVPQAGLVVRATAVPAGLTITGDSAVTSANGRATFTSLTLTGTAGSYTLRFSAAAVTSAVATTPTALGAGAAARLGVLTQPSTSAQSGVPLATQPVIQVRDAQNNAARASGVTVTAVLVSGSAALSGATAVTDGEGQAHFTSLTMTGTIGAYTLRFGAPSLDSVTASAATTLTAGPASQLTISTAPSASASNTLPLAQQPVVRLRDGAGNFALQAGVVVRATLASGTGTLAGDSALTDGNGRATFSALAITGVVGQYLLSFGAAGFSSVSAAALTLGPGPVAALSITTSPPTSASSGQALSPQPVIQLRDVSGNAVPQSGTSVTAGTVEGGVTASGAAATTNSSGEATFTTLTLSGTVGSYTLRFTSGSVSVNAAAATQLGPGSVAQVVVLTQPSTAAQSGIVLGTQPVVAVRDAAGNGVPGRTVVTTAASSAISLSGESKVTDAAGVATFTSLTMSGPVGTHLLRFTVGVFTSDAGSGTVLTAGPAATITVTTAPSAGAQSGVALVTQPVVVVRDAASNPVPSAAVTATAGAASVGGGSVTTNATGVATFTTLTLTGAVGSYTIAFASGAAAANAPAATALAAGPPATVTINTPPPANTQSGVEFPAPQVTVRDGASNPVPAVTVTASVVGGGATVINGTATTSAGGVAVFSGFTLQGPPNTYTIRFTAGAAFSDAVTTLADGPATTIALTQEPSASATVGVALAQQPKVRVTDGTNNLSGIVVQAGVVSGSVTISGGTAVTGSDGIAQFTGLALTAAAGSYTLRFTAGSLTVDAASPTVLASGAATALSLSTQPSTAARSGIALGTQPVVRLKDAGGNTVAQAGVTITVSLASGSGLTLTGASAVTDASGIATFSGLTLTGAAGSYSLRFSDGALTPVSAAAPTSLSAGPATQLAFTTPVPPAGILGIALDPTPVVQLRDASGNPLDSSGATVTASTVAGAPSLAGTQATTSGSQAGFASLAVTSPVGTYRFRFAAGALPVLTAPESTVIVTGMTSGTPLLISENTLDAEARFGIVVPQGATRLTVEMSGPGGADLYVRRGSVPVMPAFGGVWDCGPPPGGGAGSNETCVLENPAPGQWFITVLAFFSYQNVSLRATVTP